MAPQLELIDRVVARLRGQNVTVRFATNYRERKPATAGRIWRPRGILIHHTASFASVTNPWPSLGVCMNGRADLVGPLCQTLGGYDGSIWFITCDYAHHGGQARAIGPMPAGDANTIYWGHEIDYYPTSPMSDAQYRSAVILSDIVTSELGVNHEHVRAHFESSVTGKIDPAYALNPTRTYDMNAFRVAVRDWDGDDMYTEQDRARDEDAAWRLHAFVNWLSNQECGPSKGAANPAVTNLDALIRRCKAILDYTAVEGGPTQGEANGLAAQINTGFTALADDETKIIEATRAIVAADADQDVVVGPEHVAALAEALVAVLPASLRPMVVEGVTEVLRRGVGEDG